MDVGDEGGVGAAADLGEGLGGLQVRNRQPDDLAPGPEQGLDLPDGRLHVPRVGVRH
jgi:hypothetical protein